MHVIYIQRGSTWVAWGSTAREDLSEQLVKVLLIGNPHLKWKIDYES